MNASKEDLCNAGKSEDLNSSQTAILYLFSRSRNISLPFYLDLVPSSPAVLHRYCRKSIDSSKLVNAVGPDRACI